MPSYRVTFGIGLMHPGHGPEVLVPALTDAGGELTTVEHTDIAIVAGQPRIVLRFTAAGDRTAAQIGNHIRAAGLMLAEVGPARLTRRYGNRWYPVGLGSTRP